MATQKSTFYSSFAHLLFSVLCNEKLYFLNLFLDNFLVHMVHLQTCFWILWQTTFNIVIATVVFSFRFLEANKAFKGREGREKCML